MKAVKLTISNVKGLSATQELSGRDIFIGPNGSGKSTRLESFLFALLGYIPGKGKELSDTYKLCSGEELSATIETDTGFIATRTIKEKRTKHQDGDKSFSLNQTISVFPPRGEKTDNQKKDRIAIELGDFSVMFNLDALFSLSDNEKRKFIFSLTDPAQFGWTKERFLSEVGNADPRFSELSPKLGLIWDANGSVQDNVANCLAWVKQQISDKKALLKKAQGTKENLLAQKRTIGSDPGSVAELGAEYQKVKDELLKISGEIVKAKEHIAFATALRAKIENLSKKLQAPESKTFTSTELGDLADKIMLAEKEIAKAKTERDQVDSQFDSLVEEINKLADPITLVTSKGLACKDIVTKIDASKGKCPLTGGKCKADLAQFQIEKMAELKELREEATKIRDQKDALLKKQSDLSKSSKAMTKDIEKMSEKVNEGEALLSDMHKRNELAKKDAEARALLVKQIEEAEAELKALDVVDVNPMEFVRQGLAGRVRNLELEIDKRKTIANLYASFDRVNIEAAELEKEVDLLDDLANFLGPVNLQGRILKDTIGPLTGKINNLLNMTGRSYNLKPVMVDKNGKEIFDFAWEKDGIEVSFESLSGGEKVVFGAALATALVLQKNPPLKALIVEASECDEGNLVALMESLNKFGGDINNVLVATHVTPPAVEGWQVHKLQLA